RGAPTPEGADAAGYSGRIAMPNRDPVHDHPQLGGDKLRPRRLMSLSVWRRAGEDGHGPVGIRVNGRRFKQVAIGPEPRHLDVARNANPRQTPDLAALGLLPPQALIASSRQGAVERRGIIAAVIQFAGDVGGWLRKCGHQVASTDFRRVEPEF